MLSLVKKKQKKHAYQPPYDWKLTKHNIKCILSHPYKSLVSDFFSFLTTCSEFGVDWSVDGW